MTVASGTRRGSADSTPSTSVQIWISRGLEQRTEDRGGEVAAVAPERGLHAAPIDGDEAGDDQRAVEIWRHLGADVGARLRPLHCRAQRTPLHHHHAPRIEPGDRTGAARALLEKRLEQPRRPDLAVAGDQIADATRRGARVCSDAGGAASAMPPRCRGSRRRKRRGRAPPPRGSAARRPSPHAARAAAAARPRRARPGARRAPPGAAAHRSRRGTPTAPRRGVPAGPLREWPRLCGSSRRRRRSTPRTCARPRDRA